MNEYKIKQKINNCSIPPTIYNEEADGENICIYIVQREGQFGMFTESGTLLVPFEYDNISMAGFSLYLLIKNGKMGLLHLNSLEYNENKPLEILKIIPCEYDLITFPNDGSTFVYLRKDCLRETSMRIYFTQSNIISEPFWRADWNDRDYVIVRELVRHTQTILASNGEVLFMGDETTEFYAAYETDGGTAFLCEKNDTPKGIVLVEKEKKARYVEWYDDDDFMYMMTGSVKEILFDRIVRPILAGEYVRTIEREFAVGFVVENGNEYSVVNGKGEIMSEEHFKTMSLSINFEGMTRNNYNVNITARRVQIDIDSYEGI